jgi:hypothetical protein
MVTKSGLRKVELSRETQTTATAKVNSCWVYKVSKDRNQVLSIATKDVQFLKSRVDSTSPVIMRKLIWSLKQAQLVLKLKITRGKAWLWNNTVEPILEVRSISCYSRPTLQRISLPILVSNLNN